MPSVKGIFRPIRKALFKAPRSAIAPVDPAFANMEKVFRAPPMTEDLVDAIRLISPHFTFEPDEKYRAVWAADQNSACWGEFTLLAPVLTAMGTPTRILEIGPGLGRSIVFFSKKLGWGGSEIHAYDGNGKTTKYTDNGPRLYDSFCGNLQQLRMVLDFNDVRNVTIHDAASVPLTQLPRPFDLVYSFYSIGFHWSLEYFFDELVQLIGDHGVGIFTLSEKFMPFPALQEFSCRILRGSAGWRADSPLTLLVISKAKMDGLGPRDYP